MIKDFRIYLILNLKKSCKGSNNNWKEEQKKEKK